MIQPQTAFGSHLDHSSIKKELHCELQREEVQENHGIKEKHNMQDSRNANK